MVELSIDYDHCQIHGFWSRDITALIEKMTSGLGKSYATQHDIVLRFLNDELYGGKREFKKECRIKSKK